MSINNYQRQLDRIHGQIADATKRVGDARSKESTKRTNAANLRQAASASRSESTAKSKKRDSDRQEQEAAKAGADAAKWQKKLTGFIRQESDIGKKLASAKASDLRNTENAAKERKRQVDRQTAKAKAELRKANEARDRYQRQVEHQAASERAELKATIETNELTLEQALRDIPKPKVEKLRILILGASSGGDLRVGREQKRIRTAVDAALHRDCLELDVRPAATIEDLLDGIARFRPHVLHFSGHSDQESLEFEREQDSPHTGLGVSAEAFTNAIQATDRPPLLVVFNSCNSAFQAAQLVGPEIPFAIGMSGAIDDGDAINYAAQFYAAIANGQSVEAAHFLSKAALQLAGLSGSNLPVLSCATDVDPSAVHLVKTG